MHTHQRRGLAVQVSADERYSLLILTAALKTKDREAAVARRKFRLGDFAHFGSFLARGPCSSRFRSHGKEQYNRNRRGPRFAAPLLYWLRFSVSPLVRCFVTSSLPKGFEKRCGFAVQVAALVPQYDQQKQQGYNAHQWQKHKNKCQSRPANVMEPGQHSLQHQD